MLNKKENILVSHSLATASAVHWLESVMTGVSICVFVIRNFKPVVEQAGFILACAEISRTSCFPATGFK